MVEPSTIEFRAGPVFGASFGIFQRNFVRFFLIAAVARLPLAIFIYYVTLLTVRSVGPNGRGAPDMVGSIIALWVIGVIGSILVAMIVTGLLQYLSFQSIRGQEASIGPALQQVLRRLVPLVLVSLVFGILVWLGMILLIVPGILIGLALCVSVPVCLIEDQGVFASLARSSALTKGYRGSIFLVGLLYLAVAIVATIAIGIISYVLTLAVQSAIAAQILNFILSAALTALLGPIIAVIYYYLRMLKDGVDINQIASVFD